MKANVDVPRSGWLAHKRVPEPEVTDLAVNDNLEQRCAICGTPLTEQELETAREDGGPFLCSLHEAEELPAIDQPATDAGPVDDV